jgi:hypothetical protein
MQRCVVGSLVCHRAANATSIGRCVVGRLVGHRLANLSGRVRLLWRQCGGWLQDLLQLVLKGSGRKRVSRLSGGRERTRPESEQEHDRKNTTVTHFRRLLIKTILM